VAVSPTFTPFGLGRPPPRVAGSTQCASADGALGIATLRISGTITMASTKLAAMTRQAPAKVSTCASH